jgi:hypothetical protein
MSRMRNAGATIHRKDCIAIGSDGSPFSEKNITGIPTCLAAAAISMASAGARTAEIIIVPKEL